MRIAFFTDSFHEVNGVAHTSRMLAATAERLGVPFLVVCAGEADPASGRLQLPRGHAAFAVERDLFYDPLYYRHRAAVEARVREFAPDVIHVTGPSDVGTIGVVLAKKLKLPLVASWHTNLHEYAGERLPAFVPAPLRQAAVRGSWLALSRFYQLADVVLAPNAELLEMVERASGRAGFLMRRGVDTALFDPAKRTPGRRPLRIGTVGRLSVEKNIHFLTTLERYLLAQGLGDFRIVVIGDGAERAKLAQDLQHGEFTGVLRGEALARAYADLDLFVFPSRTDTFGNVVLEALASGVPAIVTASGGPKFIVESAESGYVAADDVAFLRLTHALAADPAQRQRMAARARQQALGTTWEKVFAEIELAYRAAILRNSLPPHARPAYSSAGSTATNSPST
ncbi:MAG: glycosyltransferase [Acidobacteriota bacterium]|jgi:glycosyltransferase involved in cell wall biosynthesis